MNHMKDPFYVFGFSTTKKTLPIAVGIYPLIKKLMHFLLNGVVALLTAKHSSTFFLKVLNNFLGLMMEMMQISLKHSANNVINLKYIHS